MADAVATLTGLLYSGEMEDSQVAHGYQVKGNFQQLLSKQTELITAYNAMIAEYLDIINTNDDAAVLADTGMLARLDALEAEIAGTFADGVTIRNIRVALEAGLIETSDGTTITMPDVDSIGPQTMPSGWSSVVPSGLVAVAGCLFSYGHQIYNVATLPVSHTGTTYVVTDAYYDYKTFIIPAGSNIDIIDLPATGIPIGVEWTFICLKTGLGTELTVGNYDLNALSYITIVRTLSGWLVKAVGTTAVVV